MSAADGDGAPARAAAAPMLALRGVAVSYGGRRVLDDVSLEVGRGERLALIGPSGSGKSTALRLFTGLASPSAGAVEVDGERLTPRVLPAVRRRLGYVIQDGGLFPHLTAGDNVALGVRQQGWPEARIRGRVDELLALVRLPDDLLARYPVQLSGGQRQRVALMRALVHDPAVLLLDEPLGALDPMVRSELQDDLRALFARLDQTVLLVTHDLAEAAHLASDAALLRDGRLVQRGTIAELAAHPADERVRQFVRAQRGLYLDLEDVHA
ncbi:MAG TPA: ATP-binding cassette domain-containing protein [Kofleriaceae bacterium]|nr:ATP-binding cassette domain-containing protein [Kofleriaceae bacterium]